MNKIYNDAKDKNVAAVVIYGINDGNFFYDPEMTKRVRNNEMLDLFLKGVVLLKDRTYYKAISCTDEGSIVFDTK